MFTLGSLFAGIGGIDLGFEATGQFETKWQVEIDEHANKVLSKHWPSVARWKNVTTFPPRPVSDWQCDVIAGGFPCQDLSFAGRGAGLAGERSGLFHEIIRVARIIRPRAIVLENVAALYVRGLDVVLGELAEIGYDAEWHCISAASVGAPHRRDRVFIIGYLADSLGAGTGDQNGTTRRQMGKPSDASEPVTLRQRDRETMPKRIEASGGDTRETEAMGNATGIRVQRLGSGWLKVAQAHAGKEISLRASAEFSDANGERPQSGATKHENASNAGELRSGSGEWHYWDVEPDVGRVAHGVPGRTHRLKQLGNAVVPQCAQVIATRLLEILK